MYVIGGGVSSAWQAFAPFIFEELRQRSLVYAATAPSSLQPGDYRATGQIAAEGPTRTIVTLALLGSDAGLYGAAQLPMTPGRQ
jgi:glucokinase